MLTKTINFLKNHYSFFTPLIIFLTSVLIISPWGNYAVNDDWQFFTHVRYFTEGNFKKNPLIDASFILQGFIGLYWTQVFGLSFVSLRALTIIFTILFFLGFYRILRYQNVKPKIILVSFFALLLEPFILTSALSFMTEIYFLTFMVWSLYFFIRFLDQNKIDISFWLAIIIGGLSILIRQFGVVLLIGYLITIFVNFKITKKSLALATITTIFFSLAIYFNFSFPQYDGIYDSKEEKYLELFANYNDIFEKISFYPYLIPYLVFFLSPILINIIENKFKKLIIILSIPLAFLIFSIDIFNLKNVFHLECYYCESNFYHEYSVFDNVPFKFVLAYFLSFLILNTIFKIYLNKKSYFNKIKKVKIKKFALGIISLGMFLIPLAVDSFYDRYFINFNVLLILFLATYLNEINLNLKYPLLIFGVFYLIILFLNIEFHNSTFYKWKQGFEINKETKLKAQILLSGAFSRYLNALEKPPEDLIRPVKFGIQKCYVLRHVKEGDNFLIKFFDSKIFNNRYIYNPTFSNVSNINPLPKSKDYLANSIYLDEYQSPMFNLIGQKTYIVTYCIEDVTKRYNIPTNDKSNL